MLNHPGINFSKSSECLPVFTFFCATRGIQVMFSLLPNAVLYVQVYFRFSRRISSRSSVAALWRDWHHAEGWAICYLPGCNHPFCSNASEGHQDGYNGGCRCIPQLLTEHHTCSRCTLVRNCFGIVDARFRGWLWLTANETNWGLRHFIWAALRWVFQSAVPEVGWRKKVWLSDRHELRAEQRDSVRSLTSNEGKED